MRLLGDGRTIQFHQLPLASGDYELALAPQAEASRRGSAVLLMARVLDSSPRTVRTHLNRERGMHGIFSRGELIGRH